MMQKKDNATPFEQTLVAVGKMTPDELIALSKYLVLKTNGMVLFTPEEVQTIVNKAVYDARHPKGVLIAGVG